MRSAHSVRRVCVLVVGCIFALLGARTGVHAQTAEPTHADQRQQNVSIFMADLPADRFLLEPLSILRNPLGLMLLERASRALRAATPKTCVIPEPDGKTDEATRLKTSQDVTDDLMVQALIAVLEKIDAKRWAQVDVAKRDAVLRAALTDEEFETYKVVVRTQIARDAMTLKEYRLEADAAVELGIAFDRYLTKSKFAVNGPINPLESRPGLEAFDKLLEQIEDSFVMLLGRTAAVADFDRLMALEAKRVLALVDVPEGTAPPTLLPFRPKLKHLLANVPIDTDDIWQPMEPVFTRLCIEKRSAGR